MENLVVVSDFDGTITKSDALYCFFEKYASPSWLRIENLWQDRVIDSKECLLKECELIPNFSKDLVDEYINTVEIDDYFIKFYDLIQEKSIDFIVVSDGFDYFINRILENNGLSGIKVISNHLEFIRNKFEISFPNDYKYCKNEAGTCKCKIIDDLKLNYQKICYIGDGLSDYCVAGKVDFLFAKANLLKYCKCNEIKFIEYNNFNEVKSNGLFK